MKQHTGSCYPWRRGSRTNRSESSWLHATLGEMEEKTQNMLNILEAKSDSFSQRAEFFYHKRPQLISMIEEYYKAYRALAEQFDRLKRQTRQNSPESVQVFNGSSCEAPLVKKISVNENLNEGCKKFLRSQGRGSDSEVSEAGDPDNCNPRSKRLSDQESINMIPSDQESGSASSHSHSEVISHFGKPTETENVGSEMREKKNKLEEESSLLYKQVTAKNIQVEHLKIKNNKLEEKAYCKEEMSLVMQDRNLLQKDLEIIIVENTKLRNENENEVNVWEMNDLLKELYFIREENAKLRNENEINVHRLQILTEKVSSLQKENKSYHTMSVVLAYVNEKLQKEMCGVNQQSEGTVRNLKDEKKKVEVILEAKENLVLEQSFKIKKSQTEVCDRNLKLDIIRAENAKLSNGNEANAKTQEELRNENEVIAQRVQELMNGNEINGQKLQVFTKIDRGNRHGKGQGNVQMQVLSEKLKRLEKENSNLSKRNNFMSLSYVNSQAARLDKSNTRGHTEISGANFQRRGTVPIVEGEKKNVEITVEAKKVSVPEQNFRVEELQRQVCGLVTENAILMNEIEVNFQSLQVPKENYPNLLSENSKLYTQRKNVEIILEEKEKLVVKQSLKIGALQNEVYQLLDENRVQEIQLLERNEKIREAVRQLCFTLDALMDKNKRLQKALQKIREEEEFKTNNIETSNSQTSRWRKFLYSSRRIRGFSCIAEEAV
ncbi:hypothetical protein SUGI_0950940 [Cryptomeria japonica]|uniref:protein NETWORKED 4B n=1 Tax=Cryptomeria japonica TaxID=3369 RepID=UPI002414A711|nr:protein NETWORKED 4B [Cryptomeria japonica]XP_057850542.2 protein NETWORKED 4B [Cryptomeria japonica]XP_059067197.1 protein NETWORKED 4B [Cryptomeria japonica]GLJ45180.1 hypothetical protein SUGI_0950940 [Cryptomeria japonica]